MVGAWKGIDGIIFVPNEGLVRPLAATNYFQLSGKDPPQRVHSDI